MFGFEDFPTLHFLVSSGNRDDGRTKQTATGCLYCRVQNRILKTKRTVFKKTAVPPTLECHDNLADAISGFQQPMRFDDLRKRDDCVLDERHVAILRERPDVAGQAVRTSCR